ncbi:MAG: 3-phosphoshikimate 1-carboxyvinyltransferase [Endomicrobium sp.]|jgi:3-phosphoshikimate 1-carboxyvinyltransferase|nr:3-phosphoshikimate 1-carboxyvinyltransferase [Endomicrobium sp.]
MDITLSRVNRIEGIIEVPADKSITHRAVILSSIAEGMSVVKNYLPSDDCLRTIEAFRLMGVDIKQDSGSLIIEGRGLSLNKPKRAIYAGNSGTTARLMSGILAGQNFESILTGDESLSKRPMERVIKPLTMMGAGFEAKDFHLPMTIIGALNLRGIHYKSAKSSAQVKSAVLFAGLYANGITSYSEPFKSRDHSEKMLRAFGADIEVAGNKVSISKAKKLNPQNITVAGDISSAAFFIAAALLVPDSCLTIKNVGINPTRDGFIECVKKMGADITFENVRDICGEPVADIIVRYSPLKAFNIDSKIVPRMIDEIPIYALLASRAEGTTKITGALELRVKESDRISAIASQFKKIGVEIEELEDGFIICGNSKREIQGGIVDSFSDHRIAMTLAVAALIAKDALSIKDASCVNISFPNFYEVLKTVCH